MEAKGKGADVAERVSFETWMHAVNVAVEHRSGKTTKDLPCRTYRNWYNHDCSPVAAAKEAMQGDVF